MVDKTIQTGEKLQLNFDVENRGTRRGSQTVELLLDDEVVDEAAVVLDSTETGQLVLETDAFSDEDDGEVFVVETVIGTRTEATFEVEVTAIPDSRVSRDPDDPEETIDNNTNAFGLRFETEVDWPERFDGRLSEETTGATRAYIYKVSDESLIGDADVSSVGAGNVFSIGLSEDLDPSEEYNFVVDGEGSEYQFGRDTDASFPYISSDENLTIIGGGQNESETSSNSNAIKEIGNLS